MSLLFSTGQRAPAARDLGLLVLRLGVAVPLVWAHGWGKLQMLLDGGGGQFPDPLGVGNQLSLVLAVVGEVLAPIGLALGLLGRFAALPVVVTFVVAFFMVHADDPFDVKEKALLYLVPAVTLLLTGPGRLSLDQVLGTRGARGEVDVG